MELDFENEELLKIFVNEEEILHFLEDVINNDKETPLFVISVPKMPENVFVEFMTRNTEKLWHNIPKDNLVKRCESIEEEIYAFFKQKEDEENGIVPNFIPDINVRREELRGIIRLANEELETPDRSYFDDTDEKLKDAVKKAEEVLNNKDATLAELSQPILWISTAICDLSYK